MIMSRKLNGGVIALLALLLFGYIDLGWQAYAGPEKATSSKSNSDTQTTNTSVIELSGEEVWSMNCQRCHNIRPPTMYSAAQWEVIVHHMRVRANITGAEQRAVAEFLKSSSSSR